MQSVTLYNTGKIFFTSDLHFDHRDILTFAGRPFEDTKSMNQSLIDNWNNVVTDDDTVFILGDICWFNYSDYICRHLNKLNGFRIYICCGNHDDADKYKDLKANGKLNNSIYILDDIARVDVYDKDSQDNTIAKLILCHYPLLTWSGRQNGVINLFGHIHSGPHSTSTIDWNLPYFKDLHYDVGVDNNNYKPVELTEILDKLKKEPE